MKSFKRIIKTYMFMFSLHKKICPQRLVMLPFYFICQATLPFVPIIFSARIIDNLVSGSELKEIILLIAAMCLCELILRFAYEIMSKYDIVWDSSFSFKTTGVVLKKYMEIDLEDTESGEVFNQYSLANEALGKGVGFFVEEVADMCISLLQLIGASVIISTMNPILILVMVGFTLLLSLIEKKVLKYERDFDTATINERRKYSYIYDTVNDFQYGKEIRIYGIRKKIIARIEAINNRVIDIFSKNKKLSCKYQIFFDSIGFIQQAGIYGYMIFAFARNAITIGGFTIYIASIQRFTQALTKLGTTLIKISDMSYRIVDVQKFLSIESKLNATHKVGIQKCEGLDIRFEDVSFCYPNTEMMVLKDVNITIKYGEKLVIVGENGAGKTTFTKLLLRLYDPTKGTIYLGNVDIRDLPLDEYHRKLSCIFQDYRIFSFSVKDNITFGIQPETSDADIMDSLKMLNMDEKIAKLPKGLHTYMNNDYEEDGIQMSGGETQRIAIARAINRNANITIMDECTSALDAIAEREVFQYFKKAVGDNTCIFISHRMSTARLGDKIALFHDGEIEEYGAFDDLMMTNGRFTSMYNKQAQYYVDIQEEEII